MTKEMVVLVTCPAAEAERIAEHLIGRQVAACVNIVPGIRSIYRWQGEICRDDETLLLIKSHDRMWTRLEECIRDVHPYDVPEIISLPIEIGNKAYLDWLNSMLGEFAQPTGKDV